MQFFRRKTLTRAAAENQRLVEESGLFDAQWYLAQNPDLSGVPLLDHYLHHGGLEGRSPGPDFDGGRYLKDYPDVDAAQLNPLVHFLRTGKAEGRTAWPVEQIKLEEAENRRLVEESGLFDAQWYLAQNPDLSGVPLLDHYLQAGGVEGRSPGPDFDGGRYLKDYPDVDAAQLNPLVHYLRAGKAEGRTAWPVERMTPEEAEIRRLVEESGLFDAQWYLAQNPDLSGVPLLDHYLQAGGVERRSPGPDFDGGRYLKDYPDVDAAQLNPLVHYLRAGKAEGRTAWPVERMTPEEAEIRRLVEESGLFDAQWYLAQNPDLSGVQLLDHYLQAGGVEGRSPGPDFDGGQYLRQYPDVASAKLNPLVHYLLCGKAEGRFVGIPNHLSSLLSETLKDLGVLEPDIINEPLFESPQYLPYIFSSPNNRLSRAWDMIFHAFRKPYDFIIFTSELNFGDITRVTSDAVKLAIQKHESDSVLLVCTDGISSVASERLPQSAQFLTLSSVDPNLTHDERVRIVELLIYVLKCRAVLNIESHACWDAFKRRGRGMAQATRLYAYVFHQDILPTGRSIGYLETHFRACIPALTQIYLESNRLRDQIVERFRLPQKQIDQLVVALHPTEFPPMEGFDLSSSKHQVPFRILWAGQFSRRADIDLLIRIVELAPDIEFEIYGQGDDGEAAKLRAASARLDNLVVMGRYKVASEFPRDRYSAVLYTALWEGLSKTLIDLTAIGIPVIAPAIGGISELVDETTGWIVNDTYDPKAYLVAVYALKYAAGETNVRTDLSIKRLRSRHSWCSYSAALSVQDSFFD